MKWKLERAFCALALAGLLVACANSGDAPTGERAVTTTETPAGTPDEAAPEEPGDFRVDASYVDDSGGRVGTRWVHTGHGMPVTVLRIQSVPQVFLYVNTPPVSDRGEPHTGEHLLLGKGRKGKVLSASGGMSLVGNTAWTSQSDVVYAWNCAAGKETFYKSVERYLDALLLPNYTDEEVRREVMNLGVVKRPDGTLALEEKGTIYNEMVSSYERRWLVWRVFGSRLWGENHALSYSSGGEPAAVREMEPHHIHDFHRAHYHLSANIGMIVALPDSVPEAEFLDRLSIMMALLDATEELQGREKTVHGIPDARPQEDRSLEIVPYPNANEGDGGAVLIAWPPKKAAGKRERVLTEILLNTVGQGQTATLYKRLMDSATREVEVDASELFAWLEVTKVDVAPFVGFDGFPGRNATPEKFDEITGVIRNEFGRVAGLAEGGDELAEFNRLALVKLTEWEKELKKQLNSPPLFGVRGSGGFWLNHLRLIDMEAGDERVVTMGPIFRELRGELEAGKNPWKAIVAKFGLTGQPYQSASVASPEELQRRKDAKAKRIEGYVEEMKKRYGTDDAQAAIAKYSEEYDAATAELAEMEKGLPKPRLVDDVPLTADPSLVLEAMSVEVPAEGDRAAYTVGGHRGVFDNVGFVEISLSFPLGHLDETEHVWLPILPSVLTSSGVVDDGEPVPYDEAQQRRSREIYQLSADYATRADRGRYELRATASGLDLAEAERAVDWLRLSLYHPWIAEENAARLRDLVKQAIQGTRATLGGREETWVRNPAEALRNQDDPLHMATSSHHTKLFHLSRLEWKLTEPPPEGKVAEEVDGFLKRLAGFAKDDVESTVDQLDKVAEMVGSFDDEGAKWMLPLVRRLKELVGDMAPGSLKQDLGDLASVISADLAQTPSAAIAELASVRANVLGGPDAGRFILTGSRANTDAVAANVAALIPPPSGASFDSGAARTRRPIRVRMADHQQVDGEPVHFALLYGSGTSGVFLMSGDAAPMDALDENTLTGELAARVFGGAGAHGFFMKTWGAGLAYSNGLRVSSSRARISYYAERCPDLTQTMKFVTGLVRAADELDDPYLAEYAVSLAVGYSRASGRYEDRTRSGADDVVDGDTPERVAKYREAILKLRKDDQLWSRMKGSIVELTGRALPGVGPKSRDVAGGNYLVIAPPKLIDKWEEWVKTHEGEGERVYRIYPRDFWILPD